MTVLWLGCELFGIAAAALLTPLTLHRSTSLGAHYALQRAWSGVLWWGLCRLYRMRLEVEGEPGEGPYLLLVRHSSTADTLLPQVLVCNPLKHRLRYVLKNELRWDPCLDIVGGRLPNAFVKRGLGQVERVGGLARDLGQDGIVIWPEGTRFSKGRRARRAEKDPRALELSCTLPPRTGGVRAVLEHGALDVVFCAHRGFEGVRRISDLWNGALLDRVVHVKMWRSQPEGDLRDWLFQQWKQVDAFASEGISPSAG